jgi:PAS domain S-box-containing protein
VIEVLVDRNGRGRDYIFLEINPAFERLTGIADAVGRSMRDIAPAHEQHWFDRYADVALTGKPTRFENRADAIAGGRWFDVFAFRVDEPEQRHVAVLFADVTARKEADERVAAALAREREANALLDAIFESAPIGLAFVDRELRFRRINPRLAEMNGLPASEHLGRRPDEVLLGVSGLDVILERWRGVIETGESWLNVEIRGETPAQPGVARSWSENFFPVRVDNRIVGLGAVVEETTARDQARDALVASEARFRGLIELGPVGILIGDPDGRIVLANDALLSMLGYTRDEADRLNWVALTPPEYLSRDAAHLQALREGKRPPPFEKEYIRRDGSRIAVLIVARFLPGEGERTMAYALDITHRRTAERRVQESAAQLRRLIDHMAAFVSMLDRDGTLLEVNEPALRRGGLQRDQVIGRKFWECPWWTHDPVQQRMIEEWCRRARDGETIRHDTVARTACDGRMDVDFMLVPVFNETGTVTHLIPSGVDISDRKRVELALRENEQRLADSAAALRDADRRKDDFLATLAHELRNPLAPIRNGIQVLRLIAGANPTLERTSQMMERQMQHLVRLVDDLLDVSRITRGKIKLRRNLVLINEVVSSALESCETLFEPHGHTLSVVLCAEPLTVLGDRDRLRQVFANLLSNAAKFTPREGSVWVTLERSANFALVRVKDTGIGIPPERLKHVFEMFAQVNAPEGNDGLGIGLALARQLVSLHGGWIEARSEGIGRGSEFMVCLPLVEGLDLVAEKERSTRSPGVARKRILIVDDNIDAALSLAHVLSLNGHSVSTATGGEEAVNMARENPPDIILLDLGMPGMNGLTAARLIREQPGGAGIRIIALTGWGQERDRQRTREAGIEEHLVKPVDPEALLTLLEGT